MGKISKKRDENRDSANSEIKNDENFQKFKALYDELKAKYSLSSTELLNKAEEKELMVPATVFSIKLSPLETISKYLKENLSLSNKEVSKLINRSEKTIWQAYNSSKKKFPKPFEIAETKYVIPISKLGNRKFSAFESVVDYLKVKFELSYHEIAVLLGRDDRTIWTIHHRAKAKRGKK